ncbi:hypothetical protein COT66_01885 [Candidatus Shapirobacteria bacterium CG09_land_8_20_14_0_10_49_15]|uniref:DUF304 domain-containing protein n=2 Tax=Candidatus Shapironibacteriota TaxID=1752721 RepID=A0A2M8L6S0_9BACT|nr:MAG: hypothetical protein COT66_01885 [Candidatus Shapirobacteria bacterium CG09_land_8_20_14_0_10_49_15]PJE69922.1 MAG: hypothetical protein COU97_02485 [Candidatus Shapirobacteria bacterium CG10_big_fil_rev_8_21_14_0_10_48_15]
MPDIFVDKKVEKEAAKPVEPITKTLPLSESAWSSFVTRPKKVNFETQERREKVVLLLRRHWLTNVPWALLVVLMLVAPAFFSFFPLNDFLPGKFHLVGLIGWYLLTTAVFLEKSLSWLFNVNLITDERIVDIDFPTLLYRHISSAKIDHIEDISVQVGGFVRSLFNYGDVLIQTAGTQPEICFEAVPQPARVVKILNEMMLQEEQEKLEGRAR